MARVDSRGSCEWASQSEAGVSGQAQAAVVCFTTEKQACGLSSIFRDKDSCLLLCTTDRCMQAWLLTEGTLMCPPWLCTEVTALGLSLLGLRVSIAQVLYIGSKMNQLQYSKGGLQQGAGGLLKGVPTVESGVGTCAECGAWTQTSQGWWVGVSHLLRVSF